MSGHSKWANIKHRKGKSDAQRGKIFTKIGREIAIVVREGGPDPETNTKLRDVIAKAKSNNMPNDNIERSIKKASGETDVDNYEEIVYEGYGPGGIAIIVEAMTDNKNRTASEIRHCFDKAGGNLGTNGCVSFMFEKKGVIIIKKTDSIDENELMTEAVETGAQDLLAEEDCFEILTEPGDFTNVRESLEKKGYELMSATVEMISGTNTSINNEKQIQQIEKLIDKLEDLDDVQNVYDNWERE